MLRETSRVRSILKKIAAALFISVLLLSSYGFAQDVQSIQDISLPEGFERIEYQSGSYPSFLRNLPLKLNKEILKWDGDKLNSVWMLYDVLAVLKIPLLYNEDIEQCADFSMRLWSEYLQEIDQLDKLYLFDYSGNSKPFSESGKSFNKYLRWHMAFSNSHSIKKGAAIVPADSLRPGDMFVQNESGGIGHVSVIVDAAQNAVGEPIFLVGFGYMPAQEFHIEKAKQRYGPDGWFTLGGYKEFLGGLQFRRYGEPHLMRYK